MKEKPNNSYPIESSLSDPDKQMIERWKQKKRLSHSPVTFKGEKPSEKTLIIQPSLKDSKGTEKERDELYQAAMWEATGASDPGFASFIFTQTIAAMHGSVDKVLEYANMVINTFQSFFPQDEIEGMLVAQLIALQAQAMEFMARSISNQSAPMIDANVNRSNKLLRLHHETLEALIKYRKKGTQTMVVQHVHVNQGGQAIVGQVQKGGDSGKN